MIVALAAGGSRGPEVVELPAEGRPMATLVLGYYLGEEGVEARLGGRTAEPPSPTLTARAGVE